MRINNFLYLSPRGKIRQWSISGHRETLRIKLYHLKHASVVKIGWVSWHICLYDIIVDHLLIIYYFYSFMKIRYLIVCCIISIRTSNLPLHVHLLFPVTRRNAFVCIWNEWKSTAVLWPSTSIFLYYSPFYFQFKFCKFRCL